MFFVKMFSLCFLNTRLSVIFFSNDWVESDTEYYFTVIILQTPSRTDGENKLVMGILITLDGNEPKIAI